MKKDKATKKAERKAKVIEKLKSLIAPVIFLMLIAALVVVILRWEGVEVVEEVVRPNGFTGEEPLLTLENDELLFEMDTATTQFALTVKDSGKVWYSNPQDVSSDALALSNEKNRLNSTMILTHTNQEGADLVFNNYAYSIENQIYDIESGEDYIKVTYSIGEIEREFTIPPVITMDMMNDYKANWEKNDYIMVTDFYKKYDIKKLSKSDKEIKDELIARFPLMETEVIYAVRDTATVAIKTKLEGVFAKYGYTYEQYQEDKKMDTGSASTDKPVFNIPMIYRLDGGDLTVEVPYDEIEYLEDHPIYYISVLPYFGAAGKADEGYLLVPEGGGAVIDFNNGKTGQNAYFSNVYGWDMCLDRLYVVNETKSDFAMFAEAVGDDAFLCILEDSKAYAAVQADIAGKTHSYNFVNAQYTIQNREKFELGVLRQGNLYKYVDSLPVGEKISQRYRFIDSGDYVDIANEYRNYLMEKYDGYFTETADTETPVMIEVIGAIDKVKQVMGVPMSRPLEVTTFEEAENMLLEMYNSGLKNMSVKMSGWANGGVEQKVLNNVNIVRDLGGKKDLKNLIATVEENGIDFYLNGITNYAYNSTIFNGFNVFNDAARFISRKKAELYRYDTITFEQSRWQDSYYLLSQAENLKMIDNLKAAVGEYGTGIAFEDLGKDVSADYNRKALVTRETAMKAHEQKLKEISDSGMNVMLNGANDYAVAYADMITNMDFMGTDYAIIDRQVPFYQIVLHGYKNYVGESINIAQDYKDALLKSVESGAGLSFTLMDESSFALQSTFYTHYFGSEYAYWKDRIVEEYTRYNNELGHTFNQKIVGHEFVGKKCTCTTYEDGTKVYVNYDYSDAVVGDLTVPSKEYVVIR